MAIHPLPHPDLCEKLLVADEAHVAYFARRAALPGVALFTAERPDAPEFDLAVLYRVPEPAAPETLAAIVDHFRAEDRQARVRLTPLSAPSDWSARLRETGFEETDERFRYMSPPETPTRSPTPAVIVRRAATPTDADHFSAIQAVGFDLSPAHEEWDRALARRHLTARWCALHLATLEGETVAAAKTLYLPGGVAGLSSLATLPAARGYGVAATLLQRMIDDARAAGCTTLFGTVEPGGDAERFYDRLGWITHFGTQTYAAAA